MYKWQQIKALRAGGMGIKSIAKKIWVSKNTVRRYLRSPEPPEFKTREYEKILDRHEEDVQEMLTKEYIGTRIYSELSKIGYQGSLSTVHRYIHEARREARRDFQKAAEQDPSGEAGQKAKRGLEMLKGY